MEDVARDRGRDEGDERREAQACPAGAVLLTYINWALLKQGREGVSFIKTIQYPVFKFERSNKILYTNKQSLTQIYPALIKTIPKIKHRQLPTLKSPPTFPFVSSLFPQQTPPVAAPFPQTVSPLNSSTPSPSFDLDNHHISPDTLPTLVAVSDNPVARKQSA